MASNDDADRASTGGLFMSNSLENGSATANTPCKTIPAGLLENGEELNPDAMNAVETIAEVNPAKLYDFASEGESRIEQAMEDKLSETEGNEVTFCFWKYTGGYPISKQDAQRIVTLSEEYSDVITPPLQDELLAEILHGNADPAIDITDEGVERPANPNLIRVYRTGVERILEAAKDSEKLTMAPVPFLQDDLDKVKEMILDYSEYDGGISLLAFNLLRKKPTSDQNATDLTEIIGFMRRIGYFNPTIKFAVNVMHSYSGDGNLRSAEDLCLAGMGFDFIGENHWRPRRDYSGDYETKFRAFDTDMMTYWEVPDLQSDLDRFWPKPDQTGLNRSDVRNAKSEMEIRRQRRLFNAEQVELALAELRNMKRLGQTEQFVESYDGLEELKSSMKKAARTYDDPSTQASFGEF